MQKILLLISALLMCMNTNAQLPVLVKNINTSVLLHGNGDAGIAYNSKLLFLANDSTHGYELWISDGTDTGTHMVKDANPNGNGGFSNPLVYNGKVYYSGTANNLTWDIWVTDGTDTGTHVFTPINPGVSSTNGWLGNCNGKLYMGLDDGIHGFELWTSDGTDTGTHMVKDISPGTAGLSPKNFYPYNGKVYFDAGGKLWVTDGTDAGTVIVNDKYASSPIITPSDFTECNGKLYFAALQAGTQLYVIDGNEAYTVRTTTSGTVGSLDAYTLTTMNNKLYYLCGYTASLWTSDGTDIGTVELKKFYSLTLNTDMLVYNNKLHFTINDGTGYEPWYTDGTLAGTLMLKRINGNKGSFANSRTIHNGNIYFAARDSVNGLQLWVTDGTAGSTKMIMPPGANFNAMPSGLVSNGLNLYFSANYDSSIGHELYRLGPPDTTTSITVTKASTITNLTLYPNPTKEIITLQYTLTEAATPIYRLYDINGRSVASWLSESKLLAGKQTKQFNISHLPPASYQLQVEANGSKRSLSIIKQ